MSASRTGPRVAFALIFAALSASAQPNKSQCINAYERAQEERKAGRLKAAREQLITCAANSCPELTRPDCITWLRDVEAAMPTIILRARDADGRDVVDVRVWIDGELVFEQLQGNAIQIDPGRHTVRFQRADDEPGEQAIVIVESEKNRIVMLELHSKSTPKKREGTEPKPSPAPSSSKIGPLSLGAFGLVSLGVGAYFETKGIRDRKTLFDDCAPKCSNDQVDDAYRELLIGDIAAGVGIVSLAGAVVWLIVDQPSKRSEGATAKRSIRPAIDLRYGGPFAGINGTFE